LTTKKKPHASIVLKLLYIAFARRTYVYLRFQASSSGSPMFNMIRIGAFIVLLFT